MTIAHISPALPPTINGVGDYAVILAETLRKRGVEGCFVSATSGSKGEVGFPVRGITEHTPHALVQAIEATGARTALLHFSGYGYAKRGLCWWLAEGLRKWKRRGEERRLVTIFHELYATGPIWRSSFWTALPRSEIARSIADLSDAALATSPGTAARLRLWRPDLTVVHKPVFSNFGELTHPTPLGSREPHAVALGQESRRKQLYATLVNQCSELGHGLRRLGVTRILDIGPRIHAPDAVFGLSVEQMGPLEPHTVAEHLSRSRVGLVDYPRHVMTKSGIIAAYLAHGLLVVNTSMRGTLPDGLEEGRQFANPSRLARPELDAGSIAARGFAWYAGHSCAETAQTVFDLLQ